MINNVLSYHDITLLPFSELLDVFKEWQEREKLKAEQAEKDRQEQESQQANQEGKFQSFMPKGIDSFGKEIN